MNLYKFVDNNFPSSQILSLITLPILSTNEWGFVGKLDKTVQRKIFELLNFKIDIYENILLVYLPPKSSIMIHSDYRTNISEKLQTNQTFFLPLKNCSSLKWNWWSVPDKTKIFEQGEKDKFNSVPHVHEKDAYKLESIIGNSAFIANVKQWHNLVNTGEDYAIGISFRFFPWSNLTDFSLPPFSNTSYEIL